MEDARNGRCRTLDNVAERQQAVLTAAQLYAPSFAQSRGPIEGTFPLAMVGSG
jgi:hypothetical protein